MELKRTQGNLFHLSCVGLDVHQFPFSGGGHWAALPSPTHKYTAPFPRALNLPRHTAEVAEQLQAAIYVQKGMLNIRKLCVEDGAQHSVTAPGLARGAAASGDSCREGAFPLGADLL